jgi:hypothetical protein
MKRFFTFGLLGPLLGFVVLCVVCWPLSGEVIRSAVIAIPATFAFLLVPLLLCALLDFFLDEMRSWERLLITAMAGFGITAVALFSFAPALIGASQGLGILLICLCGAIPAVVCSWLLHRQGS